jgi:hypothetical protein
MRALALLGLALLVAATSAAAEPPRPVDSRDLQALIDAAPDGGRVELSADVIQLDEPLLIRGKRLTIHGAGDGRDGGEATILRGPAARPVVDDRGAVILPIASARGLFELVDAEVELRDLSLSGFDAGVVVRDERAGGGGETILKGLTISHTGRGIISLSPRALEIKDSLIDSPLWHGIALALPAPSGAPSGLFKIDTTEIINPLCAGIYFENALVEIKGVFVGGAFCGAIAGDKSFAEIKNSVLLDNRKYGIGLRETYAELTNVLIKNTKELNGLFGDGIVLAATPNAALQPVVKVKDVTVKDSERAGLSAFGTSVSLKNASFCCQTFDLNAEPYLGEFATLIDLGGNQCGCPDATGACTTVGAPAPPDNLVPIA